MKRDRLPYLIIPLAALIAILPLIVNGCSCGHDFDFHIVNWFEVAHQLRHGTLYPQWAATPAWNAGEPRFVFYPPLSWFLGAFLGLIMPWTWTPIAYTWIALSAAGLALYAAARDLGVSSNAALLAAIVYTVNPYMLYTAYERTAYAELLAAAWLPLLTAAILRERVTATRVAIPVALLWLTNAPAAVMGCYTLALLVVIRLMFFVPTEGEAPNRFQLIAKTTAGTLLGLGMAAFYIVPAAYERRWVQIRMAILPGIRFSDNFLFHRTSDSDHDTVLQTASLVALVMIAFTAAALFFALRRAQQTPRLRALAILAVVIVFLLTPLSAPVWSHTPELPFLQFPWRFLAVLAVVFALALAHALPGLTYRATVIASFIAAVALTLPAYRAFRQQCDPEDTVPTRLATFNSSNPGSDPTDEYTPTTANNDVLAQDNPPYWLAQAADAAAPKAATQNPGPAPHTLDLTLDKPQTLILNLRQYPAWDVRVNNNIATLAHRADGLIAIPLAAGPAHIRIAWRDRTDRMMGNAISVFSLALFVIFWRQNHSRRKFSSHESTSN